MVAKNQSLAYPNVPAGLEMTLEALEISAKGSRTYFNSPECPYSDRLRGYLQRLVASDEQSERRMSPQFLKQGAGEELDRLDLILQEVEATIDEMNSIEAGLVDADTGDRIQFVKAKTALLEKWVSQKEKIYSLREVAEFQQIVIKFMEAVLDKDQRHQFIASLRNLKSTKNLTRQDP
jgi:hypothetical protein